MPFIGVHRLDSWTFKSKIYANKILEAQDNDTCHTGVWDYIFLKSLYL